MLLNLDNENSNGVYALSIVNNPAMESYHVLLETQDIKLKVLDEKKHIVSGVVLIPNKLITRIDKETGEPYQIFFSAETIEKTSQQFLKDFNQKSITVEHMLSVDNVTVVESWIKSDDKMDKGEFLGIEAPVGSWFLTLKVEDMNLWDGLLESGLLNGFSIEGKFEPKEINKRELTEINMDKQETKEKSIIKTIRELLLGKDEVILADEVPVVEEKIAEETKETKTYELNEEEAALIEAFRLKKKEEEVKDEVKEEVPIVEEVMASKEEVPVVEEPLIEKVEAAKVDIDEIVKKVKAELEPQMIPHTDVELSTKKNKPKFDHRLTTADRIKLNLKK